MTTASGLHVFAHLLHLLLGIGHQTGHLTAGATDQMLHLDLGTDIQGKFERALDITLGILDWRPAILKRYFPAADMGHRTGRNHGIGTHGLAAGALIGLAMGGLE